MPVITLSQTRFSKLVGKPLSVEEMSKLLPWIGVHIEEEGRDYVKIEFNPNRIDLCSHIGVARAFKGLYGLETGQPRYEAAAGKTVLKVEKSVAPIRPYIVAAVVKNINLEDDDVKDLMEMQEDLHWGVGRNRKKASIGVHNLDAVQPPFTYKAVAPDSVKFVPLDKTVKMTPREILEKHEKGVAFRNLLDWAPAYPLLVDKNHNVLSLPPIINGELTRVDDATRNLFIDVTGTDWNAINRCLNVLVTALSDMGGTIETVQVQYQEKTFRTPDLAPSKMKLRVAHANQTLGLRLSEKEVAQCLAKCRLGVKETGNGILEVSIPPYRIDILHEDDLVEEAAIGYGYNRLRPTLPQAVTIGGRHEASVLADKVRQALTGLGFIEVMNFVLNNEKILYENMRVKPETVLRIANPVSSEFSILRQELLPGVMQNLRENRHKSFPQRLFEVSDVIVSKPKAETRTERRLHVAAVTSHANANFTEIKAFLDALLSNLGLRKVQVSETAQPSYLDGRAAMLHQQKRRIGIVGEIHPEVLGSFELENPVGAFELDLEWLLQL